MRGSSQPATAPCCTSWISLRLLTHRVAQVEARELDLLGMAVDLGVVEHPVVELAIVLELEGAQGVGDAFDRVRQTVREVVHRVDLPRVVGPVVVRVANDPVEDRIAHQHVLGRHVDLGAQHLGAVGKLAGAHAGEEVEVLFATERSR